MNSRDALLHPQKKHRLLACEISSAFHRFSLPTGGVSEIVYVARARLRISRDFALALQKVAWVGWPREPGFQRGDRSRGCVDHKGMESMEIGENR